MLDLEGKRKKIRKRIDEFLSGSCYDGKLLEAARYAAGSGKALRPTIVLLVAETYHASIEKALDAAIALELVHSYSLIHDDLPCMDDDDFRRGKPTVHKVYGEAHALLTGDFLLTSAFEALAGSSHLSDSEKTRLTLILAKKAGGKGMVAGQVKDLDAEGKRISLKELYFLHLHKTALLFTAAFEFGGVVSNANTRDMYTLASFGKRLGLSYQIADDIADAAEDASDSIKKKATAVTVLGEERAEHTQDALYLAALAKLEALSLPAPFLKEFAQSLIANFTLKK